MKKFSSNLVVSGKSLIKSSLRKKVIKTVEKIYDAALLPDGLLSIHFVLDSEMKKINKKWRGKNKTTDVLSFAMHENEEVIAGFDFVLGDIVISVERAKKQAKKLGHTLDEEIGVLFAHGVMHILGLDHEKGKDEAILQTECEMTLLDNAGISPTLVLSSRGI